MYASGLGIAKLRSLQLGGPNCGKMPIHELINYLSSRVILYGHCIPLQVSLGTLAAGSIMAGQRSTM